MSTHPQTIRIVLPGGDPQGMRMASITTRIVQLIEVPRSLLASFLKMPEAGQVGVYFLIGESEGEDQRQVCTIQTGALADRLGSHHQRKEFWNRALVAISRTHTLTSTAAGELRWLAIGKANVATGECCRAPAAGIPVSRGWAAGAACTPLPFRQQSLHYEQHLGQHGCPVRRHPAAGAGRTAAGT